MWHGTWQVVIFLFFLKSNTCTLGCMWSCRRRKGNLCILEQQWGLKMFLQMNVWIQYGLKWFSSLLRSLLSLKQITKRNLSLLESSHCPAHFWGMLNAKWKVLCPGPGKAQNEARPAVITASLLSKEKPKHMTQKVNTISTLNFPDLPISPGKSSSHEEMYQETWARMGSGFGCFY